MSKEEPKKNSGLQETLEELDEDFLSPDLIQDNKLNFTINENLYRVRMPNQREVSQAEERKNSLYIKLIQRDGTLTKKKLKKILKEKQDIDIEKMQEEANKLEKKLFDLYISLAQCKSSEKKTIADFKKQIAEVKNKRMIIILDSAEYLSPSIESQVENDYMKYLTAICTEKYTEEDRKTGLWSPVWSSLEVYEEDSSNIAIKAIAYLTHLLINIRS